MGNYKFFTTLILLITLVSSSFAIDFNQNGDFTVSIDNMKKQVYNNDIDVQYSITILNNKAFNQKINLDLEQVKGWDIELASESINLNPKEEKTIEINLKANSQFNYDTSASSPDKVIISQNNNYIGYFEFPLIISGDKDSVSLNLQLNIEKPDEKQTVYSAEFATKDVSPANPLNFAIRGDNIKKEEIVDIIVQLDDQQYQFQDTFNPKNNYQIYEQTIPTSKNPGIYDVKVIVRAKQTDSSVILEWNSIKQIEIIKFSDISEKVEHKKSFFIDKSTIQLENLGNVDEKYSKEIDSSYFKNLFFYTNTNYTQNNNNIIFTTDLNKGEIKTIEYSYNYIPIYVILLIIIAITSYIIIRKSAMPLDVETKIYQVKRVKHEGIKSMKIRIGFENIKETELDNLSLIFRMPKYLNIKDNSFLLTEPNQVLKGRNQYKLIWDFKRFEKNETRILGFTLVNARGILGDVKIPDLELEVKVKGKIKKYYHSIPVIKG